MRKQTDQIPEGIDEELQIRCDAGEKLLKDLWLVINRNITENAITHWEVLGCIGVLRTLFEATYITSDNKENKEE